MHIAGRNDHMVPSATAFSIHGTTSCRIFSRPVLASNPSSRLAFSVDGTRRFTSWGNGGSEIHRNAAPELLISVHMALANSRTVFDSGVERLKSSLSAAGC